ncbi:hypothetical protein EIN_283760 [Entamoeba invadens IP1]|uniref:Leucine-rich repeat containing protein n=1 Tax=Entamoeba invadens IP1 TaxID=370355 RepID=L7FJV1_ENTIV|nr:hypothetical protein EIN_283760 [Entamoeba invadens IP1]ELP84830.1 hypothetical protein EIN_283760 [Entamoeba invadens IP1]|eukprot:XP_004184176.1 hypothetical protein EIN_283760 [Entamoeba invadens IP1]
MRATKLLSTQKIHTIIQQPISPGSDSSKTPNASSTSSTPSLPTLTFGQLSIPDLMVIALQLDQPTTNIFFLISTKCKSAIHRLKTNSFYAPLDVLKKYFPAMETLALNLPPQIPKTKYRYNIISNAVDFFKPIASYERHVTVLHLIVQTNSQIMLRRLKNIITLSLDFTRVALSQYEAVLIRESKMFSPKFLKAFFIYCQAKDVISAKKIVEVYSKKLMIKVTLIVDGLDFHLRDVDAVLDNSIPELKNIVVLQNEGRYIITSAAVNGFAEYLPLNLKIKGCDEVEFIDLTTFTYLNFCSIYQQKGTQHVFLPPQLKSLKLEETCDNIVNYTTCNLKSMFLSNCTLLQTKYPVTLQKLSILHCFTSNFVLQEGVDLLSISYCNNLKNIQVPKSLKKLQLVNCIALTLISSLQSGNLTELEMTYCPILKVVNLPSTLKTFSVTSCEKLEQTLDLEKIGITEFKIVSSPRLHISSFPDSLKKLHYQDYTGKVLELNEGITELKLSHCETLEAIYFPGDLKYLKIYKCPSISFEGIQNLEMESLEVEGVDRIEEILIPLGLTRLFFADCKYLKLLDGMSDLTNLKELLITTCPMINNIFLPNTITKLELSKCKSLSIVENLEKLKIKFSELVSVYYLLESPILPLQINDLIIEGWLCKDLPNLQNVQTTNLTINNCSYLSQISLPNSLKMFNCNGCKTLQKINIKNAKIENITLDSCTSLKHVQMTTDLTYLVVIDCFGLSFSKLQNIPLKHFGVENITTIKSIKIPSTLNTLQVAFCDRLTELKHLKSVSLKELALISLFSLKTVTFPTSITNLVLENCDMLKEIKGLNLCAIEELKISGLLSLKALSLPTSLTKLNMNMCEQITKVEGLENCKKISSVYFFRCPKLNSFTFPKSLKLLSLDSCNSLTSLNLETYEITDLDISLCEELVEITFCTTITNLSVSSCFKIRSVKNIEKLDVSIESLFGLVINTTHPTLPASFANVQNLISATENYIENSSNVVYSSYSPQLSRSKSPRGDRSPILDSPVFVQRPISPLKLSRSPSPNFNRSPSPILVRAITPTFKKSTSPRSFHPSPLASPTLEMNNIFTISNWKCVDITNLNTFEFEDLYVCNCSKITRLDPPTTVTNLIIESCNAIQTLSPLPKLVNCSIRFCSTMNGLYVPKTLTQLQLLQCEELSELHGLEKAKKLAEFSVKSCNNLRSIALPKNLKKIFVEDCERLNELNNTVNAKIEELLIEHCDSLEMITVPSTLTKVTIEKCYSLKQIPDISNICPNLKKSCVKIEY